MESSPETPIAIPVQCPGDARFDRVRHNRDAWLGAYIEDAQEELKVLLGLMARHDLHMPGLTIAPEWATIPRFANGGGFSREPFPQGWQGTPASDRLEAIRRKIRSLADVEDIVIKLPEAIFILQDAGIRLWGPADAFRVRVIGQ